jgi:hypothetical protein
VVRGALLTRVARAPILLTVNRYRWLPAIIQARPPQVYEFCYRALTLSPPSHAHRVVSQALRAAGVHLAASTSSTWEITLPWRTMVYGVIRRDVEETATVSLTSGPDSWELVLRCEPVHTHNAHAAGAGGVLAMAAAAWLAGGWTAGLLPGLTTVLAGGLWTDVARVMALDVLERRLRRLTDDLGTALWPGVPAQLHPPPRRLGQG